MVQQLVTAKPGDWVMNYIYDELSKYYQPSVVGPPAIAESTPVGVYPNISFYPFFPASSNVDISLVRTQFNVPEDAIIFQYDTMFRLRTQPFYRIKKEQLMMYVQSGDIEKLDNALNVIIQSLDREDVAAQDVNRWGANNQLKLDPSKEFNIFFHKIRVFVIDESRDLLELNSVNLANNRVKLIVEMDYHVNDIKKDDVDYITYD